MDIIDMTEIKVLSEYLNMLDGQITELKDNSQFDDVEKQELIDDLTDMKIHSIKKQFCTESQQAVQKEVEARMRLESLLAGIDEVGKADMEAFLHKLKQKKLLANIFVVVLFVVPCVALIIFEFF